MLYIGLAGILGAIARFGLSALWNPTTASVFPWGTFSCNLIGCLILGFLTFATKLPIPTRLRLPITTGFIGSFTTFSTFSYETMNMLNHGYMILAALYVLGSLWGGLGATWLGVRIGESVRRGVRRS
ncbi:fluoride efflux transporter CrcB [Paenibacillus alginolyticus]|uniref:Fluoride-specific ion channel FluC n=1 Tax=Paenibacillus alginolyticus TaxID=59839 RepID=A0ABT4GJ74_9BACL|nr:fluoride efflux transporter CrcB [Paenibacillus alginolyticus]MCY9668062.1 fluoride efflux transporter CrcB [Paenibacillus alginolyticus]MCY9696260.1 fluoride efflux transporter CrcB [Paenibacillus alginolyticus]MEC0142535.1 fluoride efflux transporter CrcB [Paenibacillus alginolyticus]